MGEEPTDILADVLGCKWTLGILRELEGGARRPSELRRALAGISDKVLTERLRKLERFGLVRREERGTVPPHVTYELSRRGKQLRPILASLRKLSERWESLGEPPRPESHLEGGPARQDHPPRRDGSPERPPGNRGLPRSTSAT